MFKWIDPSQLVFTLIDYNGAMVSHKTNRVVTVSLVLALIAAASLPKGYMMQRSADNLVKVVICRGFAAEPASPVALYIDMETGKYVEREHSTETTDHNSEGGAAPCHFSVIKFDGPCVLNAPVPTPYSHRDSADTLTPFEFEAVAFVRPNPRAPPIDFS